MIGFSILIPNHYTVFNKRGIKYSGFYEFSSHFKKYSEVSQIQLIRNNRCQNVKIIFKDKSVWDLRDYKELHYRGDKEKLARYVADKTNLEIKEIIDDEK